MNTAGLGAYIRRRRRDLERSQDWLAERCGMSQKKLSQIELGNIDDPGLGDVVAICNALDLSLYELLRVARLHVVLVKS